MAKFRRGGLALLVFNNLKCRSMGIPVNCSNRDSKDIVKEHSHILIEFSKEIKGKIRKIKLSTATVTTTIEPPLKWNEHFWIEAELFSGAKLLIDDPAHVNVFANGKFVITGITSIYQLNYLLHHLNECIHK